jgi:hypothetical protein
MVISPKYLMTLVTSIEKAIWAEFSSYKSVGHYIDKWQERDAYGNWENFAIRSRPDGQIDLSSTLHSMPGELLLKIAIEMGVETPDFIPSIPTFKNAIKSDYKTASATFEKAFKQLESHPDTAIGLANSALESIIKEMLLDERVKSKVKGKETLYDLTCEILKVFQLFPGSSIPLEIKSIGSALLTASQNIEKLRSEKTDFHGKTANDYVVKDPLYAYFIINSVTTVGLFLNSFFRQKFPKTHLPDNSTDDLPF